MVIESLECNYKCGTHFTLAFRYKIEHKDKISGCACGDESLSGICIEELASPIGEAGLHSHKTNCSGLALSLVLFPILVLMLTLALSLTPRPTPSLTPHMLISNLI